ncbi:DUF5081 family protein [Clostridium uliginosum]|uniref:Uncharacterized protein n=1 Tax=Clostridium uliginosum TaxID=119641 RepID=A0A1I1R148_9CLOT|nr:DUF5081 family protein [Clostridium uliginosum]SFD27957.1 protein of unknown function [Clostridium uliginosum]
MLSASELYYLNSALDGTNIYGINPIETLINNQECEDSPKESLIMKDILKSHGELNEKSFRIIRNLEKYKNAKEYIWVNNLLISIDETDSIVFLKKYKKGQFILEETTKSLMIYSIFNNYMFLCSNDPTDSEKEILEPSDLIVNKLLNKKSEEVLCIQKEKNKEFNICNIYYKEGYTYRYDTLKKELMKTNPRDIRLELLKIFEYGVSE